MTLRLFAGASGALRARCLLLIMVVSGTNCTCGGSLVIAAEGDAGELDDGSPRAGRGSPTDAARRLDSEQRGQDAAAAPAAPTEDAALPPVDADASATDARAPLDASAPVSDAGRACAGRDESGCRLEQGCLWLADVCATRCTAPGAEQCAGSEACDFVSYGGCGVDLLCVPRAQLAVRCQTVSPLCGGAEHSLCLEAHHDGCSDCEACDDVPRLFCAFAPDGTMYVLQGEDHDVLRVEPDWTASGSFFAASTLSEEQEARCDAVRPLPTAPLPCP